jgi:hypothetical protein
MNSKEELKRAAIAERRRKEYERISTKLPSPVIGHPFADPSLMATVFDLVRF